jgi:hypothetical protein
MVAPAAGEIAHPWYTEANVQTRLIGWLREHGYFRAQEAATVPDAAEQPVAFRGAYDQELWVRVAGLPEHRPETEAERRFAAAILDLIRYRNENKDVSLALALPDDSSPYTAAVAATAWLQQAMPFHLYWVAESGTVRV